MKSKHPINKNNSGEVEMKMMLLDVVREVQNLNRNLSVLVRDKAVRKHNSSLLPIDMVEPDRDNGKKALIYLMLYSNRDIIVLSPV